MQTNWKKFHCELVQKQSAAAARAKGLRAEQRGDEAAFEQIRSNVYGIFASILEAADSKYGEDTGEMQRFLCEKLESIPAEWKAAAEKAVAHGDERAVFVEKLKLRTADEIRTGVASVGKEGQP